jgi:cell wall-associated NlpC family hydrolase
MKRKSFTALALAFIFSFSAIAMQGCNPPSAEILPPIHNENTENDSGNLGDSENENLENDGGMVEITPPINENPTPSPPSQNEEIPPVSPPAQTPTPPQKQTQAYIRSVGNNVNLRSGAGTNFAILGTAEKDTTYAVIGKKGNWYETYYRGKRAYFYAEYAAVLELKKSENEAVEKVIQEGYKHIGVPYVYGAVRFHDGKGKLLSGFTAQKFDCSSLMQYIFYKGANVLLQVTTRTQVKQGTRVKSGDLQRGDCMYFTNSERKHLSGVEKIGHVALYLGDNYILHTASDYARIEKISAKRWEYFIEARRFL